MIAVESSLSYRGLEAAYEWAAQSARYSITGRALHRLVRSLGPWLKDGQFFGTGRISSKGLDEPSSLSWGVFTRSTTALQSLLAGGRAGRGLRAAVAAAPASVFARGDWLRLVGAGALGLGCGMHRMLFSQAVVPVVLIVGGLALILGGPLLVKAVAGSRLAGLAGVREAPGDGPHAGVDPAARAAGGAGHAPGVGTGGVNSPMIWVAMALCAAAGAMAGASSGAEARITVALVLAIAAVALLLWRPEVILLAVAAFPWLDWAARHTLGGLGPLWDDALLVVSAGLVLWSVFMLGRGAARAVPIALPVLVTLAAAIGSIVVRKVPTDVGFYALRVLFEPILFYFVGFLLPKNRHWVRWTITVFLAASTALALHGLYQYATHAPMPANWVDVSETAISVRAYSVVQNPNVLGAVLAMGALISGSLVLSRASQGVGRVLLGAACLVQLGGLAVTFSRGAWLGFVIGLLATIVLAYRRYLVPIAVGGVVAWFAAPQVFVQRLLFTFSSTYAAKSSAGLGRLYRWDAALHHVVEHPLFGLGLGTFGGTTAYLFGYWALWVDDFYLQMAAEGGLLLLVLFLWLLLRGAKGLVRGYRVADDPYLKAVCAGMFGAFLAVIVANAFEADWETLAVGVEFWFLAGLVTSVALEARVAGTSKVPGTSEVAD